MKKKYYWALLSMSNGCIRYNSLQHNNSKFSLVFKKELWFVILFAFPIFFSAQKSSPISGDAAMLMDLLYKDYNSNADEMVLEEIGRDRSKAIAIFKSYSIDLGKVNISDLKLDGKTVEDERSIYLKILEDYNSKIKQNDFKDIERVKESLMSSRKNYYKALYRFDTVQLLQLERSFKENKFLQPVINKFIHKYKNLNNQKIDTLAYYNNNLSIQKGLPFSGGDILVDGIDGLSRFLAKRIKEELTLNAIENIQTYLRNENREAYLYELEAVLPTTVKYLQTFDADQLLKFSDDLKQYIEQDLNNILKNSKELKSTPRIMKALKDKPELDFAFEGLEILDQVSKMKSPVDYFAILENSRNLNSWKYEKEDSDKFKIAKSWRFATMLAYSFTIIENGEVRFVTTDFIKNYGSQKDFSYLYLGFLNQQNLKYYKFDVDISKILTKTETDIVRIEDLYQSLVMPVSNRAERLHSQFLSIKKKKKNDEKVEYKEMHQLIKDILDFTKETMVSGDILLKEIAVNANKNNFSEKLQPYFAIAHLSNDITLDLHEKRYTNAITKAIEIPFTLNISNKYSNIRLQDFTLTVQNLDDLKSLAEILSIDPKLEEAKRYEIWHKNISKVKTLYFKFSQVQELSSLNNIMNEFSQLNEKTFGSKYNTLSTNIKNQIRDNQNFVLDAIGLNYSNQDDLLSHSLKQTNLSKELQSLIYSKIQDYNKNIYGKIVLNENIEISIDGLNDLQEAFFVKDNKNQTNVLKFIHFVNDVAVSDSPESYQKAIEAFVLPVGSSSLKEKMKHYYSINAYPGILGGFEKSKNISSAWFIGFTAPIGIYFQPWKLLNNRYTLGFFMPIIDIAAPVRLRLDKSNDTKTLPDFKVEDIFSPGFYISFGMKNSPLAFNLGIQYGPKLRDIPVENSSTFTSAESYRIGLGITLDIPLLTISSKTKD